MRALVIAVPLTLLLAVPAAGATGMDKQDTATLKDSVTVLNALADAPDKGIPQELFAKAHCILVFPSVTKAAFIVGGKGGHGVASCRQPDGRMGPPAMYKVGGASIGFQAGVDKSDFVMLVMNETGMKHLLQDKFTFGAEATATAGPVGRTAHAATDAQMQAQILSWSRTQGLFAGVALDGSVVTPDKDANKNLYGEKTSGAEILMDSKLSVPAAAKPVMDSIRRHMGAAVAKEAQEDAAKEKK